MTGEILLVFCLLLITIILFISDRIRLDVVAILVILALMLTGLLSPNEALAGFGDPVVMLIAGLFVVGEGLYRTGIAHQLGNWMMAIAGTGETRLLILLMGVVAGLSAFMSSTGAVAIFIPVALNLATKAGIAPAQLLMPMAFASLIGGMLTLIGTPPNLIVSTQLSKVGLAPFNFFSFTPIGLLVLVIGIVYMILLGRRLLPTEVSKQGVAPDRLSLGELAENYGLTDQLHCLRIRQTSSLLDKTVAQAQLRTRFGVTVLGVEHRNSTASTVTPAVLHTTFQPDNILYVVASEAGVSRLVENEYLDRLPLEEEQLNMIAQEVGLAEVLLTPRSDLIGLTLSEERFRARYGLSVLGILRKGKLVQEELIETPLAFGDSLLMGGGWRQISRLQREQKNFLVLNLPREIEEVAPARAKAPRALAIVFIMLVLMAFNLVPSVTAVILAALAMVVAGCTKMEEVYKAINWQSLVLIAGMLPMATALEKTGGLELIVNALVASLGTMGPLALMTGLFLLTSVFSQFISNTATTVLVAPIAVGAAQITDVSPYPLLMTVALAASTAFATPVASPVNTLVLGPGAYRFNDFVKVGVPLQLLAMVITLATVPLFFPL